MPGTNEQSVNTTQPETGAATQESQLTPLSKAERKQPLFDLQVELVKLQEWVKETGAKVCVLFEGRDTAKTSSRV